MKAWLHRVVAIAFLVQFMGVLGAYFAVHNYDIPGFVRVYGSNRVVAGWPTFVTISAYSRHSSMPTPLTEVAVALTCDGADVELHLAPPSGTDVAWYVRYVVPAGCTSLEWSVSGRLGEKRRSVDFSQRVSAQAAAADAFATRTWAHRETDTGGQRATASLRLLPTASECPIRLSATTPVGHLSRFIRNDLYLRFVGPGDIPSADLSVSVARGGADDSPDVLTTDTLGVAVLRGRFEDVTTLGVTFDCDGEPVTRHIDVAPGWEHERIAPSPFVQNLQGRFSLAGEFERTGQGSTDALMCDGVWIGADAHLVAARREQVWEIARTGMESAGVSWCAVHRLAFWSQNPQRTTSHALRRPSTMSDGAALASYLSDQRRRVPERLRPFFAEPTEQLMSTADSGALARFAGWLAGAAPQYFEPLGVLGDDLPQVEQELAAIRTTGLRNLRWVLFVEGGVLLLWAMAVLVPATLSQRRRFADVLEDLDDDLLASERGSVQMGGGWLPLVLSIVMICMFLVGLAVLLQIMR